jgi:anti-sigma factor RsiW
LSEARPIKCRDLVRLVTDYFEGALSPADRSHFEAHLRGCPWCTRYIEQMRKTVELTGTLREDDLSPRMRDTLLNAFRDWKASSA